MLPRVPYLYKRLILVIFFIFLIPSFFKYHTYIRDRYTGLHASSRSASSVSCLYRHRKHPKKHNNRLKKAFRRFVCYYGRTQLSGKRHCTRAPLVRAPCLKGRGPPKVMRGYGRGPERRGDTVCGGCDMPSARYKLTFAIFPSEAIYSPSVNVIRNCNQYRLRLPQSRMGGHRPSVFTVYRQRKR